MPNTIVMMTALVPTLGHKYLIDFARKLTQKHGITHVIVGTMDSEPVSARTRYKSIKKAYAHDKFVKVHHLHRDLPQDPSEHTNFWELWGTVVREFVDVKPKDIFVASELYGLDMAKVLGCKFMPCNRYRETVPIKGSTVRSDLESYFSFILPEFQHHIRKTVTLFGAESCGKTTMTWWLSKELNGHFLPEWAREYLETIGHETTLERMRDIVEGQYAIQKTAQYDLKDKPFIFQDTDLLCTLGYYRLIDVKPTEADLERVNKLVQRSKSDLYIVMNDRIPFEEDPLRYGGDKRESPTQFWIDLLDEFGCNYYVVKETDMEKQRREVANVLLSFFEEKTKHIRDFKR